MKFSEKIKNAWFDAKKGFVRFPAAVFSTLLMWFVLVGITIFENDDREFVFLAAVLFSGAVISVALSMALEYFIKVPVKSRSAVMIFTVVYELSLYAVSFALRDETFVMAFSGLTGASSLLVVYFMTNGGKKLSASAGALKAYGFALLVSLVVLVGGSICIGAFIMLVYNFADDYKMFMILFLVSLVLGIFTLLSALPKKDDADEPPKKIYKSVLVYAELSVYFALTAVLYVYLIKMLVIRVLPSGGVNPYVTIASIVYIFNIFAIGTYKGKAKLADFFMKCGGIIMLPLIVMQSVCLGIRLYHHGLTTTRMVSLCFIVLTLIFVLGSLFKKIGVGIPLIVSAVIVVFITVTPLNVINVPVWQQSASLEKLLVENGMLTEDGVIPKSNLDEEIKREILSCHSYLRYNSEDAPDYLNEATWKDALEIFGFDSYSVAEREEELLFSYYSNRNFAENGFDISEYSYICRVGGTMEYDGKRYLELAVPGSTLRKYDTEIIVDYLVEKYGYGRHYDLNDGIIPLDEGVDFYYQSVDCDLEKLPDEDSSERAYRYVYVYGFFLVK